MREPFQIQIRVDKSLFLIRQLYLKAGLYTCCFLIGFCSGINHLSGQVLTTAPQSFNYQGIRVSFDMTHLDGGKRAGIFEEKDNVLIQFTIKDTISGKGLSGAYPAAWFSRDYLIENDQCKDKVESFLTGSILHRADLDLNVYYVLTMNEDASINVVDPLFSYGGTQLLNRILLNSPGMDWVLTEDQNFLFVSMPAAKQVAVIKTSTWEIVKNIDLPGVPVHVDLQPDGAYLWVSLVTEKEDEKKASGVAVINTSNQDLATVIETGIGWHEMALSDDNQFAFISNGTSNTLSIIDARRLEIKSQVKLDGSPTAVAWSPLAKAVYVGHKAAGTISVVDGTNHQVMASVTAKIGIEQLTFAPGGRYCFAVNPHKDEVAILDAATNKIVQVADVESEPDQVNFTDGLAYVRHRNSETILMIPLGTVGREGMPVNVIDFPGGQYPAGKTAYPSVAPGIVQAAGESAVLVANPWDKAVYYYMEGMAAPMGNFSNYNREPRAVLVVDRSLQEKEEGVYQTAIQLPKPGVYDLSIFMNAPQLVHCFRVAINGNRDIAMEEAIKKQGPLTISLVNPPATIPAQLQTALAFEIRDRKTGQVVSGLSDVQVMLMQSGGGWHKRYWAEPTHSPGQYQVQLSPHALGFYQLYFSCKSKGFPMHKSPFTTIEVVEGQ